jgi:hypothetical protein
LIAALSFKDILVRIKTVPTMPDSFASSITLDQFLVRLPIVDLHWALVKGLAWQVATFGAWFLLPIPFLVAHVFMVRKRVSLEKGWAPWLTPALTLACMLVAYYFVYLLTRHPLSWLLETSTARLLTQIWPSTLVLYATVVTPRAQFAGRPLSLKGVWRTAAIAAAFLLTIGVYRGSQELSKPVIVLNKTEVVAGADSYTLKIEPWAGRVVVVRYAVDNGKTEEFRVVLDSNGEVRLDVAADVRKGAYRFLEFRAGDTEQWIPTREAVTVK